MTKREKKEEIKKLLRRIEELLEEEATVKKATVEEATEETGEEMMRRITSYLRMLGVPAHLKGYHYIREAIKISLKDPEYMTAITKWLYPEIAWRYDTTPSRVERAIRHAIEKAWDIGNVQELNKVFGHTIDPNKGRPTNTQFITLVVDELRLER